MHSAKLQKSGSVQLCGIGSGGACCRIAKMSPVGELIQLSLATMIFSSSDFIAEHMFAPLAKLIVIANLYR